MKLIHKLRQTPFLRTNRTALTLVFLATIFLAVLYFFWYWISPISDAYETGRFLFNVCLSIAALRIIVRGKLSFLVGAFWLLCFAVSILYYANFMSRILDEVKHGGIHYYLTYSQEPFDGWDDYHITARKGLFDYDSHGLGWVSWNDNLELKYDTTINKMTVVETSHRVGKEIIFSIEEENPLFYEAFTELDNHAYYLFSSCKQIHVDCQNSIYFLYQCNLDNTYCERLPFMYDGELGGYPAYLISRENISEIDLYIGLYFDVEKETNGVLIYTYGSQPTCHVEDCYTSDMP